MPPSVRGDKSLARLEQETSLHTSLVYSHKLPSMHTLNTVIAGCPGSVSKQASMTDFQHNTSISSCILSCRRKRSPETQAGTTLMHAATKYSDVCRQHFMQAWQAGWSDSSISIKCLSCPPPQLTQLLYCSSAKLLCHSEHWLSS